MPLVEEPSDIELLDRLARGDEASFVTLYRRRQAGIYRFAWHMSGSPAVAEDVTQETFLALLRQAHRYDPSKGPLASYLYGIARHLVRRALGGPHAEHEEQERIELVEDPAWVDPLDTLSRQQSVALVQEAVATLPSPYREVIVLCDLEELAYAEAAAALGQPVGTVRSRLHRARKLLARKLRAAGDQEAPASHATPARVMP